MRFALIAAIITGVLTFLAYRSVTRGAPDDFGAAFLIILAGVPCAISLLVYISLVFWNHRFW